MLFPRIPAVLICTFAAATAATGPSLQETLQKMDTVAAGFKGLKADLRQVSHVDAINEDTVDVGTIAVRRGGPKDLRILVDIQPPNAKKACIGGSKVEIYYPKINTVQEYEFGKASAMKDQLMMLAFGSNSRDLQRAYTIKVEGEETVAGEKTTRLELVPKDKELLMHFPRIQLWISDQTGRTLQQKLWQRGGDYIMATYTNIQFLNLPETSVKLDLPRNVHRERPQKQ